MKRTCFMAAVAALVLSGCSAAPAPSGWQTVRLSVNEHGFRPLEVAAIQGMPLTLLVTRESEAACAKEIIIAEAGIRRSLPVRQEVSVTFTPEKRGVMRYTCCQDMEGGRITVR